MFKQNTLSETICIKGQTPSEAECAKIAILQNLGNYPFVVVGFKMNNQWHGGVTKGVSLCKEFNSAGPEPAVPRTHSYGS